MQSRISEAQFAERAAYDALLYSALAKNERSPELRTALSTLTDIAREAAVFWERKAGVASSVKLSAHTIGVYRVLRVLLGMTLTLKFILGRKEARVAEYKTYCTTCTVDEDYRAIDDIADRMHAVVGGIEEERVTFFSNIVLGFNDALIELTGALVGFSFALRDPTFVLIAGFVTGLSASLSMAASAYQQARHEENRNPFKAALFTGVSYVVIAAALVLPFWIFPDIERALLTMGGIGALLVAGVSFYSAILLERRYLAQLGEMAVFSVGVAGIAFLIGHSLSAFL